ncbi:hypothetical protein [Nitratireductor indicus]|nr:hypothetical protein [Nitratireductor indicus]
MKVSRPGVDVLTADEKDLTFNSKWSTLALLQSGSFYSPRPDGYLQETSSVTVNFTRTYARRPMVFLTVRDRTFYTALWRQHVGTCLHWLVDPTRYMYMCNVYNNRFEFINFRYGDPIKDYDVKYYVWDFDI